MVNEFEDTKEDKDESAKMQKQNKDKEARIKIMLIQVTQVHEILAQLFWEIHMRIEEKQFFLCHHDVSYLEED